jgi:hypothetical protein
MFKQPQKLSKLSKISNRGSFDTANFVNKSNLGKPVAANFYEARNEPL